MPSTKVADKTTLDLVKTDTDNILARGGAKSDGNNGLLVYNPTTNTWDTVSGGGGSSNCIITVLNKNMSLTGKDVIITDITTGWSTTVIMPDAASISIEVPYTGTNYTIQVDIYRYEIEVSGVGNYIASNLALVSFSTATESEIKTILNMYYNDEITWEEIGWAIGDTRIIHINEMQAANPYSSITLQEQDITVTIIDYEHTDLATPINGHSKACITVQTREILYTTSTSGNTGYNTIYINGDTSKDTSFTKWANLYMRTYLNNIILEAIQDGDFKSSIKPSKHYRHTNYNTTVSELVTDTLFLPSYPEILGTKSYTQYKPTDPPEGTQFSYYQTTSNIAKYANNNGSIRDISANCNFWSSSPSSTYSSSYGYEWLSFTINNSNCINSSRGTSDTYLSPAFAM